MKINHSLVVVVMMAVCITPAVAQWPNSAVVKTVTSSGVTAVNKTARMLSVGLANSTAKQMLNARANYLAEVRDAGRLYQLIETSSSFADKTFLRREIENTIVNNTLRQTLLDHLEKGYSASMLQELADYYHLSPKYMPVFTFSLAPADTFVMGVLDYLKKHPHKPN